MVEKFIEFFTDDFSIFVSSFNDYLSNLSKVLKHYKETNLVLIWKKCHFIVQKGVVLGHKISSKDIKVDNSLAIIDKSPIKSCITKERSNISYTSRV